MTIAVEIKNKDSARSLRVSYISHIKDGGSRTLEGRPGTTREEWICDLKVVEQEP